jgi:hypothetical protein
MTISPSRHSRASRTKKSIFGPPMPIAITETGTPLKRPRSARGGQSTRSKLQARRTGDGEETALAQELKRTRGFVKVGCDGPGTFWVAYSYLCGTMNFGINGVKKHVVRQAGY